MGIFRLVFKGIGYYFVYEIVLVLIIVDLNVVFYYYVSKYGLNVICSRFFFN